MGVLGLYSVAIGALGSYSVAMGALGSYLLPWVPWARTLLPRLAHGGGVGTGDSQQGMYDYE